jgi:hypothetical protein
MRLLRRLWARDSRGQMPDEVPPAFSYKIYWTKTCMEWAPARRERLLVELQELISEASFVRNPYRRQYSLPSLPGRKYSGESLFCLKEVLEILTHPSERGAESDD